LISHKELNLFIFLQKKFIHLRFAAKRQQKIIAAASSRPKYIPTVSVVPSKPSMSNLFLNRINDQILDTLYNHMISINLIPHIHPKNLINTTTDHIKTLKGHNEKNGT
jgi:hypothetical protein